MSTEYIDTLEFLLKNIPPKEMYEESQKTFCDAWLKLVDEDGFSQLAEYYLYNGFSSYGIVPFKILLSNTENKRQLFSELLQGNMYKEDTRLTFKIVVNLFALVLNDNKLWKLVPDLLKVLPKASITKEKKRLKKIDNMFLRYFIDKLSLNCLLPDLANMEVKPAIASEFISLMSEMLIKIRNEKLNEIQTEKVKKVQQWIDSCRDTYINKSIQDTDPSRKSSEQKSRKANISKTTDKTEPSSEKKPKNENNKGSKKEKVQPENSKVVVDTSKENPKDTAHNSDSKKQESPAVKSSPAKSMETDESASKAVKEVPKSTTPNKSDNKKEAMDLESPVSDAETIDRQKTQTIAPAAKETLPKDEISRVLSNDNDDDKDCIALMAKAMDSVNAVIKENGQLKAKANNLAQELDKKETELSYANKMIQELRDEIGRISKRLNISIGENAQLQKELAAKDELISQKETELSERIEFAEVLDRDRKQQDNEAMQRIASKIKVEYRDFQDAEDIPVDCDLGENFKLQLQSIFDILEKGGIKFK